MQDTQVVKVVLRMWMLAILISLVKLRFVSLPNVEAGLMLSNMPNLLLRCNYLAILVLLSNKECLCDLKFLVLH